MARPEPNVEIQIRKNGLARVLVDGKQMSGVLVAELIQPTVEVRGPDDWIRVEKTGYPEWNIRISSKFVNVISAKDEVDGGRG